MINQGAMTAKWIAQPWAHPYLIDLPMPETAFQDAEDPYPGHWREAPEAWPEVDSTVSQRRATVRRALADLPDQWRRVLIGLDTSDFTPAERRDMVAKARATLRDALDSSVHGDRG